MVWKFCFCFAVDVNCIGYRSCTLSKDFEFMMYEITDYDRILLNDIND